MHVLLFESKVHVFASCSVLLLQKFLWSTFFRVELSLKEDDCKSTNCTESEVAQREETLPKKKISTAQEN